jgi:NitT/TauT family transport system substrate-binding protein
MTAFLLKFLAPVILCAALCVTPAAAQTKLKMILNWTYQGPQGIFFLAADRGYFKDEGLELEFDQGKGSGAAVAEVARGAYQVGFGDINTAIQIAATRPAEAPVGVYMMYNEPPFAIAATKASGIKRPRDLEGRSVAAPAGSATLKLLQLVAKLDGADFDKIKVINAQANLLEQMLQRGQVDSIAGFVSTMAIASKSVGLDPDKDINWMMYSRYGLELYGNAIVVSRSLLQSNPAAVRGLVRAVNRAVADTAKNPDAAIDALMKREPLLKRAIEKETLERTMHVEMNHPEGRDIGFGDVRDERFKRSIDQVVAAFGLPKAPAPSDIFTREFLPPKAQRMFSF